MAKADLKHYQDAQGRVFSLTESDARLLGYKPIDFEKVKAQEKAAAEEAANTRLSEREKALAEREAELDKREKALTKANEKK